MKPKMIIIASFMLANLMSNAQNTNLGTGSLPTSTGGSNTAVGAYSLNSNTYGDGNVAIGANALKANIGNTVASGMENDGDFNVAVGFNALLNNKMGQGNVALGSGALRNVSNLITTRNGFNVGLGTNALGSIEGINNIGIGAFAGNYMTSGQYNTLIGNRVCAANSPTTGLSSGNFNIIIGNYAGEGLVNGTGNTIIGVTSVPAILNNTLLLGYSNSNGNGIIGLTIANNNAGFGTRFRTTPGTSPNNTLEIDKGTLGQSGLRLTQLTNANFNTLTTATTSKVLSVNSLGDVILVDDKVGTGGFTNTCATTNFIPKTNGTTGNLICSQVFDGPVTTSTTIPPAISGMGVGINNTTPGNRLEITHGRRDNSGLRFTNLTIESLATENKSKNVLSLNEFGDVIWVKDQLGSTLTNACTTNYNVPRTNDLTGNFTCGQIFDNSATVSIGTALTNTTAVAYTWTGGLTGSNLPAGSGSLKLDVNGVTRSLAFLATSDKKFKKNITTIENALNIVQNLEGKTYNWNKESNKEINFDDNTHSGFIAQEIEKVLPHLVATFENGEKAVNYQEITPYLVEAIKEQQHQIIALNNRIEDLLSKGIVEENKITDGKTYFSSNYPNPFETTTKIDYFIDRNVKEAQIIVYDFNGTTISKYELKERASQSNTTINKGNLKTGIYFYTLITDGIVIGTKKMIVK